MTPSSVSRSISSNGALVIVPRLVPSAQVIGTSTAIERIARTVSFDMCDAGAMGANPIRSATRRKAGARARRRSAAEWTLPDIGKHRRVRA